MNYPIQHEQVANLHEQASRAEPTQGSRPVDFWPRSCTSSVISSRRAPCGTRHSGRNRTHIHSIDRAPRRKPHPTVSPWTTLGRARSCSQSNATTRARFRTTGERGLYDDGPDFLATFRSTRHESACRRVTIGLNLRGIATGHPW